MIKIIKTEDILIIILRSKFFHINSPFNFTPFLLQFMYGKPLL